MKNQEKKDFAVKHLNSGFSFFLALEKAFFGISERPKNIIFERYGIKNGGPKTLEEIGRGYKITRERVRQIIKEVSRKIKKEKEVILDEVYKEIKFTIDNKNGIIRKDLILSSEAEQKEKGSIAFFLDIFKGIESKEIVGEMEPSYVTDFFDISDWRMTKNEVKNILEKEGKSLTDEELINKLGKEKISKKKIFDYLSVSREVKKGNFKKWGLSSWDEINPKGTREKIYLILKETAKPLHFLEIAKLIDKHKLNKKKNTHPQTVHNELIRDSRFVLVGRGIYALSEWGYRKGTVKDVLEEILKKSNQPMERNEIMNKILTVRKVKKSTVLINLNNFFQKEGRDKYSLKK
jgi:DNA-directed RNA polymerase delta subunit